MPMRLKFHDYETVKCKVWYACSCELWLGYKWAWIAWFMKCDSIMQFHEWLIDWVLIFTYINLRCLICYGTPNDLCGEICYSNKHVNCAIYGWRLCGENSWPMKYEVLYRTTMKVKCVTFELCCERRSHMKLELSNDQIYVEVWDFKLCLKL